MTVSPLAEQTAGVFSDRQKQQFIEDGAVVAPGLIEPALIETLHRRLWDLYQVDVHDPATWEGRQRELDGGIRGGPDHLAAQICLTDGLKAAARELCGDAAADVRGFTPIPRFPAGGPSVFESMGHHIDGVRAGLTLYPVKRAMVMLIYLTDTDALGGATSIFPGSHRQVFEWAWQKGVDENGCFMPAENASPPPLEYKPPVPLAMAAGDVAFMHYLCVHGGSHNRRSHLRLALNGVIRPDAAVGYLVKSGPPDATWTPLDYTLRTDVLSDAAGEGERGGLEYTG